MSEQETPRPLIFSVVEDDGKNVIIEISEEDYRGDLAAGLDPDEVLKPGRYKFRRGGFLERHPEMKMEGKLNRLEDWACAKHTTLALVITDIVGSTSLSKKIGDKNWQVVHMQHSQRVNELAAKYDCRIVKDTGDGFLIVFRTAIDAFGFSVELYADTGHPDINIRVSIHVGTIRVEKNDIRGVMVNYTSRIAAWASEPWIVLTDTAKRHMVEELGTQPSEIRFLRREAELKDFGKQEVWIASTPEIRERIKRTERGYFPLPLSLVNPGRSPGKSSTPPPEWWLRIREELDKKK